MNTVEVAPTRGQDPPETRIHLIRPLIGYPGLSDFGVVRCDHAVFDLRDGVAPAVRLSGLGPSRPAQASYRLTSLQTPGLVFYAAEGRVLVPEYRPRLDDDLPSGLLQELGVTAEGEIHLLVLLARINNSASMTANLLAPVVWNVRRRLAAQVILTRESWPVNARIS